MPSGPSFKESAGHRRSQPGAHWAGSWGPSRERPFLCPRQTRTHCTVQQDAEVSPERHAGSQAGKWHDQIFQNDRCQCKNRLAGHQ